MKEESCINSFQPDWPFWFPFRTLAARDRELWWGCEQSRSGTWSVTCLQWTLSPPSPRPHWLEIHPTVSTDSSPTTFIKGIHNYSLNSLFAKFQYKWYPQCSQVIHNFTKFHLLRYEYQAKLWNFLNIKIEI